MLSKQQIYFGGLFVAAVIAVALGQVLADTWLGARQNATGASSASAGTETGEFNPFNRPDQSVFAKPPKGLPTVIVPPRCVGGCTPSTVVITDENGPLLMSAESEPRETVLSASADDAAPSPDSEASEHSEPEHSIPAVKPKQPVPATPKSAAEPDTLSAPADAAPIQESQEVRDELTRTIIRQELPHASEEERTIWFEELREFSPRMTADLLRMRKMISGNNGLGAGEIAPRAPAGAEAKPAKEPTTSVPAPAPAATPHAPTATAPATSLNQPKPRTQNLPSHMTSGDFDEAGLRSLDLSVLALETARDVIFNNIANANTVAFKRCAVHFSDAPYRTQRLPGTVGVLGKAAPNGVHVGLGAQVAATSLDFTQGSLKPSNNSLDLAIVGEGFFMIQNGSEIVYTRAGTFTRNNDGDLVMADAHNGGHLIEPAISIPADAVEILITPDGGVSVRQAGSSNLSQLGQTIQTARFVNPGGLVPRGENLFGQSDASGVPLIGPPGLDGRGTLKQNALEMSNVSLRAELQELERLQSQLRAIEQARAIIGGDGSSSSNIAAEGTEERQPHVPAPSTAVRHQTEQGTR